MRLEYLKSHLLIIGFILLQFGVVSYSLNLNYADQGEAKDTEAERTQSQQISKFKELNFYSIDSQKKSLELFSTELIHFGRSGLAKFISPQGIIFNKEQKPVNFSSKEGRYFEELEKLSLINEVNLKTSDTEFSSDNLDYHQGRELIEAKGNVYTKSKSDKTRDLIIVKSNSLKAWPKKKLSIYDGGVDGKVQRKRKYEDSIGFKSRAMKLHLDESQIDLIDSVHFKKQQLTATSRSGKIYLENYNKKLKYYVLNDDVVITEKVMLGRDSYFRKAYAAKLEGIMSDQKITLTGYPRVYQQNDVIKGNRITLRQNIEVVEVDDASTNFELKRNN